MIKILKQLFFEESLKYWHFEELKIKSKLSRERTNFYIKQLLKSELIIRIKQKCKMPYYIANRESTYFRIEKQLYGLEKLKEKGLISNLLSFEGIKTLILFGSFSRGDWNKNSDIDLFIYGNLDHFDKAYFETVLKHDIQLFHYTKAKDIKIDLDANLIKNIVKGISLKGDLEPFEVIIDA